MNDMYFDNNAVYGSRDIVASYTQAKELQKPEETIFKVLKDRLSSMAMLDIGVGGGRTTVHFAPLVKGYTGIDYAENMIKACQKRFAHKPSISFQVGDVRSMRMFADRTFDFILFSFNGLDYIDHEDRGKALEEIKRVGKPEGFFCFSTHNFGYIGNFLKISFSKHPVRLWRMLQRYGQVKELIKNQGRTHAIIRDGGEDFRAQTYYIKPSEQIRVLGQMGFGDIRVFSEKTGQEIDGSKLDYCKEDRWFYYLCRM